MTSSGEQRDATKVKSVEVGQIDMMGNKIRHVYGKVSEIYAVYGTDERIVVQYADDETRGSKQRQTLKPLNAIRGQINTLIDNWRSDGANERRAAGFDRRVADALVVALQADPENALAILTEIKQELIEERTSSARINYLILASLLFIVVFCIWVVYVRHYDANEADVVPDVVQTMIWAGGFGALGAIFSISLSIRGRSLLTDLRNRDNLADATLRMAIGSISAFALVALIKSEMVTFGSLDMSTLGVTQPYLFVVVSLLAGFSERLVGDFLGTASASGAIVLAGGEGPKARPDDGRDERNPTGTNGDSGGAVETQGDAGFAEVEDDDLDCCVADTAIGQEELTIDDELPEATGGVEQTTTSSPG